MTALAFNAEGTLLAAASEGAASRGFGGCPPMNKLTLGLAVCLFAGTVTACATAPRSATPTYTLLPTATPTAQPSATPTPLPPTETPRQPAGLPRVTTTPRPTATPTTTLLPWTPPAYTPPLADPLALSVANAAQLQELAVLGNGLPADVAWSPDGALLAVAAYDWLDLYNTRTWELAARYELPAWQVAFSPAGGYLIAVAEDQVRWLDLATGTVMRQATSAMAFVSDFMIAVPAVNGWR